MKWSVGLNDESVGEDDKVGDVGANRDLSPELESIKSPVAQ